MQRGKRNQSNKAKRPGKRAVSKPPVQPAKKKTKPATKKPPTKTANKNEIEIRLVDVPLKKHKDKNGGHYHVLVDNVDDKHVSIGLTTKSKKGKNHPNYPLEISPLNDGKHSYMRRQGTVAPYGEYENPRKGKMTPKDFEQARVYGERAKRKYLKGKKNKKK